MLELSLGDLVVPALQPTQLLWVQDFDSQSDAVELRLCLGEIEKSSRKSKI